MVKPRVRSARAPWVKLDTPAPGKQPPEAHGHTGILAQ